MVLQLDEGSFEEQVMSEGIAVIDCWAPWCRACKDFTSIFEAAAERFPQHTFATLNTQDQQSLTKKLKVSHIPTLILFRDGLLLFRQPGHLSRNEIDEVIGKAESLDMKIVREDMEARTRGQAS